MEKLMETSVDYGRKFVEVLYHLKKSPKELIKELSNFDVEFKQVDYLHYLIKGVIQPSMPVMKYLFEKYHVDANWFISDFGNMFIFKNSYSLTEKEKAVINCLLTCRTREDIAKKLNIKLHTVKDHLKHIFQKLGVHSQKEIVKLIFESDTNSLE